MERWNCRGVLVWAVVVMSGVCGPDGSIRDGFFAVFGLVLGLRHYEGTL